MPDLSNVRLFVIDALKKYHASLTTAQDTALAETLADYVTKEYAGTTYLSKADAASTYVTKEYAASTYVVKEAGKGLSTEDFTTAYMTKLDGIAEGAEVNVNADWSAASGDAQILNKPNIQALFGYAYYDNTGDNHKISFSYSSSSAELYSIDCSDFIIDGMIDSVSIEQYSSEEQAANGTSYLFIDFNTAAETGGHTDIKIPLKNIFDPNNYYNKTVADSTFVKQGEETQLAMNSNAPGNATTNHAKVISELTVSDHTITASYTDVLTGETSLSLGAAEGSGNVITSLSVSGHQITASYTQVFSADDEHAISLSGTKPSGADNRTAVVTDIVASGDKNHTLTISYANVVTSETQLSMSGSAPSAADTGYANVISELGVNNHTITPTYVKVITEHQSLSDYVTKSDLHGQSYVTSSVLDTRLSDAAYITASGQTQLSLASVTPGSADTGHAKVLGSIAVNDHTITPTYVDVLTAHQDISGKEDTSNKKTSLTVAANISDTYYPSTSAVASYIGSLEELTSDELNEIFGTSGS